MGRHSTHGKAAPPRPPCLVPTGPSPAASPAPTALPGSSPLCLSRPPRSVSADPACPTRPCPTPQGRTGTPAGLHVPAPLMLSRLQAEARTGPAPRRAQARAGCPAPPPARRLPPSARLPLAAAGADRAPPVTAAAPPHELLEVQDRLYPWASHSPPLPRADQPTRARPSKGRLEKSWSSCGECAGSAPGRFRRAALVATAVIVDIGAAALMRPARRGTDRRQTRPVPGPRVPPSWCGPPSRFREPGLPRPPDATAFRRDHVRSVPASATESDVCGRR